MSAGILIQDLLMLDLLGLHPQSILPTALMCNITENRALSKETSSCSS